MLQKQIAGEINITGYFPTVVADIVAAYAAVSVAPLCMSVINETAQFRWTLKQEGTWFVAIHEYLDKVMDKANKPHPRCLTQRDEQYRYALESFQYKLREVLNTNLVEGINLSHMSITIRHSSEVEDSDLVLTEEMSISSLARSGEKKDHLTYGDLFKVIDHFKKEKKKKIQLIEELRYDYGIKKFVLVVWSSSSADSANSIDS